MGLLVVWQQDIKSAMLSVKKHFHFIGRTYCCLPVCSTIIKYLCIQKDEKSHAILSQAITNWMEIEDGLMDRQLAYFRDGRWSYTPQQYPLHKKKKKGTLILLSQSSKSTEVHKTFTNV